MTGNPPPPPPPPLSRLLLLKQRSWSPDADRDEAWIRRKGIQRGRRGDRTACRSVTDEDLDELRGCIDLGFGFDEIDTGGPAAKRLSKTLPALDLYLAVNRSYQGSGSSTSSSSATSSEVGSPIGSHLSLFSSGDDSETMKATLRQWAQVVCCSARQRQRHRRS